MQLSKNFSLKELTRSDVATRKGLTNIPNSSATTNLEVLALTILQPLRDHFGAVKILSGYRSPEVNKEVGGSPTSDHMEGSAADLEVAGVSNYEVAKWIRDNLSFRQLILEFYKPGDPNSGWVHVSHGTKKQVLTAVKENGKTVYKIGLVA